MDKEVWRIVKIIDNYHVVVNAGAEHGIKSDTELEVYSPGEPVIDPETGEELGTLDIIKCYLRVKNLYPKMSLCINAEDDIRYFSDLFDPLNKVIGKKPRALPINAEDISGGLKPADRIKVGDLVRKRIG